MARTPEGAFQDRVVRDLKSIGAIVVKNTSLLGFPDVTAFLPDSRVLVLELKRREPTLTDFQPNQTYYVDKLNEYGHRAAVIWPKAWPEYFEAVKAHAIP